MTSIAPRLCADRILSRAVAHLKWIAAVAVMAFSPSVSVAACKSSADGTNEVNRIKRCLESARDIKASAPGTLYHFGAVETVERMHKLGQQEFCARHAYEQKSITWFIRNVQVKRQSKQQDLVLSKALDRVTGVLTEKVKADDASFKDQDDPGKRVARRLKQISCLTSAWTHLQQKPSKPLAHPDACRASGLRSLPDKAAKQKKILNTALSKMARSLPPSAPNAKLPTPAIAVQRVRAFTRTANQYLDGRDTSLGDGTRVFNDTVAHTAPWGVGVYFQSRPTPRVFVAGTGPNADTAVACGPGSAELIGLGSPTQLTSRGSPLRGKHIFRFTQNNENHPDGNIVNPGSYDIATRRKLLRFGGDVRSTYVSNCAIQYSSCQPVTIKSYQSCSDIGELVENRFSVNPAWFNHLRNAKATSAEKLDLASRQKKFDALFIDKWHKCVQQQAKRAATTSGAAQVADRPDREQRLDRRLNRALCPDGITGRLAYGAQVKSYAQQLDSSLRPVLADIGKTCRNLTQ